MYSGVVSPGRGGRTSLARLAGGVRGSVLSLWPLDLFDDSSLVQWAPRATGKKRRLSHAERGIRGSCRLVLSIGSP